MNRRATKHAIHSNVHLVSSRYTWSRSFQLVTKTIEISFPCTRNARHRFHPLFDANVNRGEFSARWERLLLSNIARLRVANCATRSGQHFFSRNNNNNNNTGAEAVGVVRYFGCKSFELPRTRAPFPVETLVLLSLLRISWLRGARLWRVKCTV